jgi:prepilin-type N-terminal cleavage/methylation domain-containing protein|tara:strand:+ start:897 stop:1346 length:450 start_codon:yes stop_codon:yes gene_type:complete
MKKLNNKNGFTLIELIMVMIILGILAAVAIPRYMDTIVNAEIASEDAVITNIEAALENYAIHKLIDSGRAIWPDNPFDALKQSPQSYTEDGTNADSDQEWTFVDSDPAYITHQRSDNSRFKWEYDAGVNTGTDADTTGFLGSRESLSND